MRRERNISLYAGTDSLAAHRRKVRGIGVEWVELVRPRSESLWTGIGAGGVWLGRSHPPIAAAKYLSLRSIGVLGYSEVGSTPWCSKFTHHYILFEAVVNCGTYSIATSRSCLRGSIPVSCVYMYMCMFVTHGNFRRWSWQSKVHMHVLYICVYFTYACTLHVHVLLCTHVLNSFSM